MSRDANASRLPLVFLPTLRSCSSHFLRAFKKNNNKKQKFIIIVKTNMKAFEIIDCTCTVASISSISRFACANVWSVRVLTKSIYVTFVGVCEAFVNICQKKTLRRKRKEWKWDLVFIQKSYMYTYMKKVEYLFAIFGFMRFSGWTCKSKPYFSIFFSLWYSKDYLKHTP